MQFSLATAVVALSALVGTVVGESHTIHFDNRCGRGTPMLVQSGKVLSKGADFTANGPFKAAIAYLQTGNCGLNGDGCTIVETTLVNPTTAGSGSSTDISLIPPLAFNVKSGFYYKNGCDGSGAQCDSEQCTTAFHKPDDTQVQVGCQADNVNLVITFCG
ncbi:hypothetical protein GSI_05589 [Ganoderma sinense ZZ0214-1]|uniref:Glycopeptide n=1 Tax=Ganoderma sinense ZZ0214-1 TaxID=1077348 RepID=A0A2G8SF12_9APHY|nr:hypothetical protein GSI_05589 [Ganoderma sinense ZZ0214-1]